MYLLTVLLSISQYPLINYFDDFLDFVIENRPTSQCHVVTFGHLITYDQWKYRMPKSMQKDWVLLHLSKDFQASIKFEPCQILPRKQWCGSSDSFTNLEFRIYEIFLMNIYYDFFFNWQRGFSFGRLDYNGA